MVESDVRQTPNISHLFAGKFSGYLHDAVLEVHMGNVISNPDDSSFAILELPSVRISIWSGDPSNPLALEYLNNLERFSTVFLASEELEAFVQNVHPNKWIISEGFSFSSESLDKAKLQQFQSQLPDGFSIKKIDVSLAKRLIEEKENRFADHHGTNFNSPEDFVERGFGYCVLDGQTIACVASTFTICNTGMDIQIDTKRDYRGKGLATVASTHLILHSLDNNIDPSWDAASETSARLAKKLGYTQTGTYKTFVFTKSKALVMLRNTIQKIKKLLAK